MAKFLSLTANARKGAVTKGKTKHAINSDGITEEKSIVKSIGEKATETVEKSTTKDTTEGIICRNAGDEAREILKQPQKEIQLGEFSPEAKEHYDFTDKPYIILGNGLKYQNEPSYRIKINTPKDDPLTEITEEIHTKPIAGGIEAKKEATANTGFPMVSDAKCEFKQQDVHKLYKRSKSLDD